MTINPNRGSKVCYLCSVYDSLLPLKLRHCADITLTLLMRKMDLTITHIDSLRILLIALCTELYRCPISHLLTSIVESLCTTALKRCIYSLAYIIVREQYLQLLLLADEQESMIDRYLERGTMFVLLDDGVKGVCVVTDDGSMIKPQDSFKTEGSAELVIDLLLAEVFVSVHRAEALCGSEHCAASVAVDAAALEHIRTHVHTEDIILECILEEYVSCNLVIKV